MAWVQDGLPDAASAEPAPRYAAAYVRPLRAALMRLGVDPATLPPTLREPPATGFVPALPICDALDATAERLGVPHLGLEIARNLPLGAFGVIEHRFSASATLGEALVTFGPYHEQYVNTARYTLELDDLVHIEMRARFRFSRPYPVAASLGLAFAVRRLRDVLGDAVVRLSAVRMVFPAPASTQPYDEFFGVPVEFGMPCYEIAFPRKLLDAPLLTANPELARVLSEQARKAASQTPVDAFTERVRRAVEGALAAEVPSVGIVGVSNELGLTPRSLQRRLREHKVSFSSIVDDVRRQRATELLARDGILLCEIAYGLGFSGVTAFFRAFRRWTGASPREFQRTLAR